MPRDDDERRRLERRVVHLERQVAALLTTRLPAPGPIPLAAHPGIALALGVAVLGCGYLGVGLPQHYFQPLFAALLLALAYHRRAFAFAPSPWRWWLVAINFLALCLFFKLVIGGGTRYPFDWLRVPAITRAPAAAGAPWYDQVFPHLDIEWRAVPALTDLSFDLTTMQSLLLIATLAGALFRFQPFASLTAILLLLVSAPTFAAYNWQWVVLFLVLGGIGLYLQTPLFNARPHRGRAEPH
jgi:hypothetical protein